MKVAFNFKNSEQMLLSEEETNTLFKQVNYLKLIMHISNPSKINNSTFKVLDKNINSNDLRSVEFIL